MEMIGHQTININKKIVSFCFFLNTPNNTFVKIIFYKILISIKRRNCNKISVESRIIVAFKTDGFSNWQYVLFFHILAGTDGDKPRPYIFISALLFFPQ